jgi:hypothetical protein
VAPIRNKTQAEYAAEAAEAGYVYPTPGGDGDGHMSRTHGRIEQVNMGADTMQIDSTQAPGAYDGAVWEEMQRRRAALRLAGYDEPTAAAMATTTRPSTALVEQVHAAAQTLHQQLDREVRTCETMIEHGEVFDVRDGRKRLAELKAVRRTLDDLAGTVEYTPSTLAAKLRAVEDLRARMVEAAKAV